jgi:hypothetical protein
MSDSSPKPDLNALKFLQKKSDGYKPQASSSASGPHNPSSSLSSFVTIAFAAINGGFQIFEEVNKLWKLALQKFQANESDKKRIREGDKKDSFLVTYEEAMRLKEDFHSTSPSPSISGSVGRAINASASKSSGKVNLATMARQGLSILRPKVISKFRLPKDEQLLSQARTSLTVYAKRGTSFVKSSADMVNVEGVLYLTTHFLIFLDSVLYRQSSLYQKSAEASGNKKTPSPFQQASSSRGEEEISDSVVDDAQSSNVMLAEWDVAAAEDEQVASNDPNAEAQRLRQQQLKIQAKKQVPATSLATVEDAPTRTWFIVPLREVTRMKVGDPSATTSTAYAEFGVTPHIVNIHLPYNMYSLTFINRPNLFHCLSKVHARVLRQEPLRPPLSPFSLSLEPSAVHAPLSPSAATSMSPTISKVNVSSTSPPSSRQSTVSILSTSPSSPQAPIHSASGGQDSHIGPPARALYFGHVAKHPLASGAEKFPESILNDTEQFASTYRARERLQEEKFLSYFHKYGQCAGQVCKGPELPILIRNGIPQSLRGHLWFTLSGAANRMMTAPRDYYQGLLNTYAGTQSTAVEQIERDLHRSMPSHPFYSVSQARSSANSASTDSSNEEYHPCTGNSFYHPLSPPANEPMGISRLRRVLVAYSWHNPVIAYCQSMNIVVATLLLYLSEEEAFYTLITLVDYLEEYWTREMMGAIVDMLVLRDLLRQKRPNLVSHLEAQQLDYSIVALPWFMCLFIGYVPMQLALRLMDCFFYNAGQGKATATLFQAALALFSIAEEELMGASDPVAVSAVLRKAPYGFDCDRLISLVFSDDALSLRSSIIDELRNYHRYNAIQNIEAQNMEEEFKVLVYGKRLPFAPKSIVSSSSESSTSSVDATGQSNGQTLRPAPPPTTAVHFDLSDLKRRYFDFKDAVLQSASSINAAAKANAKTPISTLESSDSRAHSDAVPSDSNDLTRMSNAKSLQSSINQSAFVTLFRRHLGWWPSEADLYLQPLFRWMDRAQTDTITFVEYIQGLDVIVFGQSDVIVPLIFDLSTAQQPQGLDLPSFKVAVRIIYYILLYSKADIPVPTEEVSSATPAPAVVIPSKRRNLDLQSVNASDNLDDWHLVDADERFDELLGGDKLDTIFHPYSEQGFISRERFIISVGNQLKLMPPALLNDF